MTKRTASLAAMLFALSVAMVQAANMSVQSEKAIVRATAAPFAQAVATAVYGDQLAVLAEQGAWVQVRTATGVTGWVQKSLLTTKKVVLKAGASDVSKAASGEELALAGKGFNSQVEGEFKGKNPNIDFTWIDRMEQYKVTDAEKVTFLKKGSLQAGGAP